jgi:Flp pilus assembly protein TadD
MTGLLLLALAAQAAVPAPAKPDYQSLLTESAKAVDAGRVEQARLMVARAMADGAVGPNVDRLLGDIAFAGGNYAEALARYRQLAHGKSSDSVLCERAGIAAIKIRDLAAASALIDCATKTPSASARAWNARGVLADLNKDWKTADESYARAETLAPADAGIVNNRGWSMLLRGDWTSAQSCFAHAAELDPKSTRIRNNLELVSAAIAAELPKRMPGESDMDWAERLNDAGVAAELLGEKERAIAAFTQALHASGAWYSRAANNLQEIREQ